MNTHDNNPKLTAYALGELDARDAAAVEAHLAKSETARREVAEVKAMAARLTEELAGQQCPQLDDNHRQSIEDVAAAAPMAPGSASRRLQPARSSTADCASARAKDRGSRRFIVPLSLAASLLIVAVAGYSLMPQLSPSRQLASKTNRGTNQLAMAPNGKGELGQRTFGVEAGVPSWIEEVKKEEAFILRHRRLGGEVATQDTNVAGAIGDDFTLSANSVAMNCPDDPESPDGQVVERSRRENEETDKVFVDVVFGGQPPSLQIAAASFHILHDPSVVELQLSPVVDGHDFSQYENISYGYQVPFGARDTQPREGMDNRQIIAAGKAASGYFEDLYWFAGGLAERYEPLPENPFLGVAQQPLSTFSIDVDTASYANVRRMLQHGQLPPPSAVRIEEMINYFEYDYPLPTGEHPFTVNVEVADCPWNDAHLLARVGLQGRWVEADDRPSANFVFLIDVSGSMQSPNKLPLVQQSLRMLVDELYPDDSLALVVYAGAAGMVLPPTLCERRQTILDAVDQLRAGGSTNGGEGIQLAYDMAVENFLDDGINRVILATDGDFNVGVTSDDELVSLVQEKAKDGVFLTVLGYGMGNFNDAMLEKLADKGNGNYAYIDSAKEARKVLVEELEGTLMTIARDVKVQVEFNPAQVAGYRLIGYENRVMAARDFNDDTKDAGEVGAGHSVTALYELIPVDGGEEAASVAIDSDELESDAEAAIGAATVRERSTPDDADESSQIDPLRYASDSQSGPHVADGSTSSSFADELMTVKLRYKEPDGDASKLLTVPANDTGATLDQTSDDFRFAVAVAAFGMHLRGSASLGGFALEQIHELAAMAIGEDARGLRAEFLDLVDRAKAVPQSGR